MLGTENYVLHRPMLKFNFLDEIEILMTDIIIVFTFTRCHDDKLKDLVSAKDEIKVLNINDNLYLLEYQ